MTNQESEIKNQERVWLSPPHMCGAEIKFVQEAFDTNWISPAGPHLTQFENVLTNYIGVKHCAALSSGTAAIHLALIVLGVKPGDEVVCQSFTFSGSCNPIVYQGASPVFVDSESETWNMDPVLLEECIGDRIKKTGKKPKAIIIVHLYGMPAKMDEIMSIARMHEIPVIEDAAEALGSTYKGRKCGSMGDFGILSFNGNKIITTSGGGALLSNNEEWIKKARFLATQAREPVVHYEHKEIGYNYRLSNVCAAIGLGQMTVIDERVKQRREIFEFYRNHLSNLQLTTNNYQLTTDKSQPATSQNIKFLPEPSQHFSNRWLSTIVCEPGVNEKIRLTLEKENIESRPLWKPMHLQPVYSHCAFYGKGIAQDLFERGLCLPSGTLGGLQEKSKVIEALSGL